MYTEYAVIMGKELGSADGVRLQTVNRLEFMELVGSGKATRLSDMSIKGDETKP